MITLLRYLRCIQNLEMHAYKIANVHLARFAESSIMLLMITIRPGIEVLVVLRLNLSVDHALTIT